MRFLLQSFHKVSGFRFQLVPFRASGVWWRVWGVGFEEGLGGFKFSGLAFRVSGLGFRV